MERRAAFLIASTTVALVAGVGGLSAYLYRAANRSVDELLQRRLEAVGATAARLVPRGAPGEADRALADVAAENELDGASLLDERLVIVADAHGQAGRRANLLRLDPDRLRAALEGRPSVGWAFDLDGLRFLGGDFPVAPAPGGSGPRLVLAVEAGQSFTAPSRRLRAAAVAAFALEGGLGLLALGVLARAVRASRREREAYGRAERASVTSRMAAMVAHEVRNPLGIMRAGAELLRERIATPATLELVDDILGEVARLNALTEEFLSLARDQPLHLEPLAAPALCALIDEACEKVRRRFRDGLTVTVADRIDGATVAVDGAKLRQALLNLLINAAQATLGRGHVTVEAARQGEGVCIAVGDDGPGVPQALRPRLFEPFQTGKAGGNGLGLAVARRIMEQHGGRLALAPSSVGARFEAWLPIRGA